MNNQIQSIKIQLKNLSLQLDNIEMMNFQNISSQNLNLQLMNIGIQMMNLGNLTINNAMQIPYIINNSEIKLNLQNTINQAQNLLNQMNMGNNLMMPMNPMYRNIPIPMMPNNPINVNPSNNINASNEIKTSFFLTSDGMEVILRLNPGMAIRDMIRKFLMSIGQEAYLEKKESIKFIYDHLELNFNENRKICNLFISPNPKIIVCNPLGRLEKKKEKGLIGG